MLTSRLVEVCGFARLAFGLRDFLRQRISYEEAEHAVRDGVRDHAKRFLAKLDSVVFANPTSPYLALCQWAGCEAGDIRRLVATEGVTGALEVMRRAGIYVAWEELKGRQPIVRGSRSLEAPWSAFNNPISRASFEATSGGTSGLPARVAVDLDNDAESAPDWALLFQAHDWRQRPLVFWTPTDVGVASRFLKCSKFGKDMERWFAMARMTTPGDRLRSAIVHSVVRFCAGYPPPEAAPLDQADRVLDYLLRRLAEGARPVVNTSPSAAALLARLALARGRRLEGVSFLLGAEPVTPARHRTIETSGALAVATYGTSEAGWIGAQFPGAVEPDEVHLFRDAYAVIANPRPDAGAGPGQPVLFTNLRVAAPKVLLNAELGDSAVIETGCGGPWADAYGYDVRLHTIRSYRKVTVWGATLAVSDLSSVIEDVMPGRFGGTFADYQIVEQEDERGTPLLRLLVSPTVGPLDEATVKEVFLREVGRLRSTYGFMVEEVRSMDALRIERRGPEATPAGKVLPVLTRRGT